MQNYIFLKLINVLQLERMKMIKVSIIIPIYNVEKYLKQCLDSIVNQTLKEIEIICVDDGSTDGSLEILKEYAQKDSRFIILQQKNKGAGSARNAGLRIAQGEYLYFLDSDDFAQIDLLEKTYTQITKTNTDICIFENNSYHDIKKEIIPCNWLKGFELAPDKEVFNMQDIPDSFFQICNIPAYTKLYRHKFIKNYKIKFQEIRTCNDVFFNFYALSMADRITIWKEELVTHRVQHDNLTKTRGKNINCILKAFKKLKKELKKAKKFNLLVNTFYKRAVGNFNYELRQIQDKKLREYWILKLYKFIPTEYWTKEAIETKKKQKRTFSIIEEKEHTTIIILGIKLKLNNSKLRRFFFEGGRECLKSV